MQFLKAALCLFMGLVAFVNAAPISEDGLQPINVANPGLNMSDPNLASTLGYDPSFEWHSYSMVQSWMGKDKVTVGNVIGQDLYNNIYDILDYSCPATGGEGHCSLIAPNGRNSFWSKCLRSWPADIVDCQVIVPTIGAQWQNNDLRLALIKAVAGSLAAVTLQGTTGGTNCFDMAGKKACNVGDVVRVNFPDKAFSDKGHHNYWHIVISNSYTGYGNYNCCKGGGLQQIDRVLDGLERSVRDGYPEVWSGTWYRDSRCIINGWDTCPLS